MIRKLSKRYINQLNYYYSDTVQLKPQWAKNNFYFAVMIGVLAILSSLFKDMLLDTLFTILFCIYYFFFALMYMGYEKIFMRLEPEFIDDLSQPLPIEIHIRGEKQSTGFNWEKVRNQIIDQQLYLQSGITVNDMAELFHTNRTTFSNALNKNEKQNFNAFINQLRIAHAKCLLLEKPQLTIVEISQQCGYTEQSNFTRQFKQQCNETPAAWLKLYLNMNVEENRSENIV
jgi:AraC-like DNA-binding protein